MANSVHVRVEMPTEDDKQAQADKITRLRSLRLAKEAADQEQSSREIAPSSQGPRTSTPASQAS